MGSGGRTGGAGRGGDQETSRYTSGGLGQDDTYGDEADTGGADTGYDHNYGMGSGRTKAQEEGLVSHYSTISHHNTNIFSAQSCLPSLVV